MLKIPYRIQQINTLQFAIFPDEFVNGEDVATEVACRFGHSNLLDEIHCIALVKYVQNDNLLLHTEVRCVFDIAPQGVEKLRELHEIPVDFLQYMGTILIGAIRGIIHTKTEGTILNVVVLPPVNLTEIIKEGIRLD